MEHMSLTADVVSDLQKLVDGASSNESTELPYASVAVIGKGTGELFAQSSGNGTTGIQVRSRGEGQRDDILWLASCTKLVTSIACMQLVEQGKLALDDANQVGGLCPELREVKVIQEDGSLVEKDRPITLRMLLTHTAGFGYSFLNPKLERYRRQECGENTNYDELSGRFGDFLHPLVNQPGEKFEYGISMDWAGILVERVTGTKLNDYMQRQIFQPLKIHDLSMFPTSQMKARLVGLWNRSADGRLSRREYPFNRPLDAVKAADCFHSGGAGLFGSIQEYTKILAAILNDGTCPRTGASILSSATVSEMFTNQLTDWPNFARRHLPAVKPELVYPAEGFYPLCPPSLPQGWGLGFMISPGMTGRSENTAHWSGLSNVFWWIDRKNGVAGVVASQVLPFADPRAVMLWVEVEGKVYEGLKRES